MIDEVLKGGRASAPPGFGGIELRVKRSILIGALSRNADNAFSYLEPTAAINGQRVPFGWGVWFYPLPPGSHELTVWPMRDPDSADYALMRKVDVSEGETVFLEYATSVRTGTRSVLGDPPQTIPGRKGAVLRFYLFSGLFLVTLFLVYGIVALLS